MSECAFDYDDAGARITHAPSESYFLLEGDPGHYTATIVVGEGPPWPSEAFSWMKVEEQVQRWAEKVQDDVDTPDLWAELQREREILSGASYEEVENTLFTPDEHAEITEQLQQIKEFAKKEQSLTEAQMLSLEAKLNDIQAAAGRIGRKELRLLILGVMFELIVIDLVPPGIVRNILAMALHALDHLFGRGGPPQLPLNIVES